MNIQNIDINLIDQHPENPRKDLGDLTELANSIKESGIHQNLTVVKKGKHFERYTCIIGHRRLAAAKLAGLTEVPCHVADMDYKTQLSTMLVENMQRAELTYIEQADGFQMMMNLGETVESIAEMSGFSKETVKHRLEIAKLDKENLKASDLTLEDLVYLERVTDIEIRNRLLNQCSHANLKYNIDSEIKKAKRAVKITQWKEYLEGLGMKEIPPERQRYRDFKVEKKFNYNAVNPEEFKLDESLNPEDCYFEISKNSWDNSIYICTERTDTEEQGAAEEERNKKEAERAERKGQLNELFNGMNERMMSFAKSLPERKGSVSVALRLIAELSIINYGMRFSDTDFEEIAGIYSDEIPEIDSIANGKLPTELLYIIEKNPTSCILQLILKKRRISKADYECRFIDSPVARCITRAVETLGYSFTDEECKLLNGTHELYVKDEEE